MYSTPSHGRSSDLCSNWILNVFPIALAIFAMVFRLMLVSLSPPVFLFCSGPVPLRALLDVGSVDVAGERHPEAVVGVVQVDVEQRLDLF